MAKSSNTLERETLISRISAKGSRVRSKSGEVFFSQGDPADSLFYLERGQVKVTTVSRQGKEAIVAILGTGDFFGEGSLVRQVHRVSTASAISDTSAIRVDKATVQRLLHEDIAFSGVFLTHLLSRNVRMEADLIDHIFNSSEKRLARLLLLLANYGQDGEPQPVPAKISQAVLAEMIGTTRARVNFFMNKFRRQGFIKYAGHGRHLEVHSSLLNVLLYDDPEAARSPNDF